MDKRIVSKSALIGRINRKLAADGEKLCVTRGQRAWSNLGDFYIVDINRNFIVHTHVDLEDKGRELRVLAKDENLVLSA